MEHILKAVYEGIIQKSSCEAAVYRFGSTCRNFHFVYWCKFGPRFLIPQSRNIFTVYNCFMESIFHKYALIRQVTDYLCICFIIGEQGIIRLLKIKIIITQPFMTRFYRGFAKRLYHGGLQHGLIAPAVIKPKGR